MKRIEFRALLNFFVALIIIFLLQSAADLVNGRILLPKLWQAYGASAPNRLSLQMLQLLALEGAGILLLLLGILQWVAPSFLKPVIAAVAQRIQQSLAAVVPGFSGNMLLETLQQPAVFLIFALSIAMLALQLLPYAAAGLYFIRYVVRESRMMRAEMTRRQEILDVRRNRMLSDIAHDIRNPMTTIAGYAQALDEGMVRDPAKQQEYLRSIRQKSERVEMLISLLFDYAKLNSGGITLHREQTDLCELLRQNTAQLYTDAEEAKMELIPEIPAGPVFRKVDPLQLSRVVNNLIANAIRYNPESTKILIRFEIDPDGWKKDSLIVADTGISLDPKMEEILFEPFSRGDSSRPTDGGSGLGLSIAKSIVELHGGKIEYRTDIDGYTKGFVISLPDE